MLRPPSKRMASILIEIPCLAFFAEDEAVGVEGVDSYTDVLEWLEAKGFLDEDSVGGRAIDGSALDEEAVANVLEIPKHLTSVGGVKPGDCPRETHVSVVGSGEAPLPEQVAGVAALLACRHEKQRQQKDVSIVSCHEN